MAITLVMMGAVVTLFANVSDSVRNRRAVIELGGQVRHVRNVLQRDLEGATCPGLTWQRPDHNRGYIEIIEGQRREGNASILVDGTENPPTDPEIDHTTSILPSSNLPFASTLGRERWVTDGAGLGDADDILMLTVRNEHEPFVGRMPAGVRSDQDDAESFGDWGSKSIESQLAEVVWFAVENPAEDADGSDDDPDNFFDEPGMRTIYRRALLIAPWINPYRHEDSTGTDDTFEIQGSGPAFRAEPGLVRILPAGTTAAEALAGLIAFQDRYDLSVRVEFDPRLDPNNGGRWKIVANTLGDLTKRENRFAHHGYRPVPSGPRVVGREYPYAAVSIGFDYSGNSADMVFVADPEIGAPTQDAEATAHLQDLFGLGMFVDAYSIDPDNLNNLSRRYAVRPFAYVDQDSATVAPARAMLNDVGEVVRVVHGLVPLWGTRRGEDVMLTDALAFDLRVYDPGAPLFQHVDTETVLEPGDPGWYDAYNSNDNMESDGSGAIGTGAAVFPYVGQGAFVDLAYGNGTRNPPPERLPVFAAGISHVDPWFFKFETLSDVYLKGRDEDFRVYSQLAPGYCVYDTWSFNYENNGLNEDRFWYDGSNWQEVDTTIDEGTNGLDDEALYVTALGSPPTTVTDRLLGIDDVGERETAPPYDKPLRGVQVVLRAYERDSRQIRQVTVKQHFMPE